MAQLFVWQFLCCNLVETAGVCETKDASKMFVEKWMITTKKRKEKKTYEL